MTSMEIQPARQIKLQITPESAKAHLVKYLKTNLAVINAIGEAEAARLIFQLTDEGPILTQEYLQEQFEREAGNQTPAYPMPFLEVKNSELLSRKEFIQYLALFLHYTILTGVKPGSSQQLDVKLSDNLDELPAVPTIETKKAPLIINLSQLIVSIPGAYNIKTDPFAGLLLRRLRESPLVMKTQSTIDIAIADLGKTPPQISKQVLPNLLRYLIKEETIELDDLVGDLSLTDLLARIKEESTKSRKLNVPAREPKDATSKLSNPFGSDQEKVEKVPIDLKTAIEYTKSNFNILDPILLGLLRPVFDSSDTLKQSPITTKAQQDSLSREYPTPSITKHSLLPALVYLVKKGSININGVDSADENLKDKIDTILKGFNLTSKNPAEAEGNTSLKKTLSNQSVKATVNKNPIPGISHHPRSGNLTKKDIVKVIKPGDPGTLPVQPSTAILASVKTLTPISKPLSPQVLNRELQTVVLSYGRLQPVDLEVLLQPMPKHPKYHHRATIGEITKGEEACAKILAILKVMNITAMATIADSPLDNDGGDILILLPVAPSQQISFDKGFQGGWIAGPTMLSKLKASPSINSSMIPPIQRDWHYAIRKIDVTATEIGVRRKIDEAKVNGQLDKTNYLDSMCVIAPSANDKKTKENLQSLIDQTEASINEWLKCN